MSFQKFKTNFFALAKNTTLGQRSLLVRKHLKKTGREINILVGQCSICNRKKSMVVNDQTITSKRTW